MKKKLFSLLLAAALVVSLATAAFAAETPTVTFDGKAITYNQDVSNFGTAFSGMAPGETRTQEIKLSNTSTETAQIYMDTAVIKAFEDANTASGGAYTVAMNVTASDGTITFIYGGGKGATVGGNDKGLYDLNGNLNSTYLAATLKTGESATISLTVTLDGESLANSYQDLAGTFQFKFSAVTDTGKTIVKTGDTANLITYVIIILAVCAALVVILVVNKRMKKKTGGTK